MKHGTLALAPHIANCSLLPRCRSRPPATAWLCLDQGESAAYPGVRLSIRSLVRWIEALGYSVDIFTFGNIDFRTAPSEFWRQFERKPYTPGTIVTITEDMLFYIVPLPPRFCHLAHPGTWFESTLSFCRGGRISSHTGALSP